jgi:multidrug efflux pump subunit AcrA (membrane-fusion protein)
VESTVCSQTRFDEQRPALPAPLWRIVLFGVVALACGGGLAYLAVRAPAQTFPGTLSARIVPITSERAGVISQWHLAEGDAVKLGQPLASMADSSVDRRRQELDAEITRLEWDLDQALAKADLELDWRLKEVHQTIFAARLQSAEYLEQKYLHEMEKVALTDLLTHGTTAFATSPDTVIDSLVLKDSTNRAPRLQTVLRLEAAANAAEVCSAQIELCDEQVSRLEELKETLPERVRRSVGVDSLEQRLNAVRNERKTLANAESLSVIHSAAIGRAGIFFKRPGDHVAVGEPIVEILDDSQRFVVLDVPSQMVSDFTIGREVNVAFPGGLKRQGRVVRVAPQAVSQADVAGAGSIVRIHVEQAGTVWPNVPIGARVDGSL